MAYIVFFNNVTIVGLHFTELIFIVLMMMSTSDNEDKVDYDKYCLFLNNLTIPVPHQTYICCHHVDDQHHNHDRNICCLDQRVLPCW